jgi:hypothetical protein
MIPLLVFISSHFDSQYFLVGSHQPQLSGVLAHQASQILFFAKS